MKVTGHLTVEVLPTAGARFQSGKIIMTEIEALKAFDEGKISEGKLAEILHVRRFPLSQIIGYYKNQIDEFRRFFELVNKYDGIIVSTGDCSESLIAQSKACGAMIVLPNGTGFLVRKKPQGLDKELHKWRDK